jgi:hypothetical protein
MGVAGHPHFGQGGGRPVWGGRLALLVLDMLGREAWRELGFTDWTEGLVHAAWRQLILY